MPEISIAAQGGGISVVSKAHEAPIATQTTSMEVGGTQKISPRHVESAASSGKGVSSPLEEGRIF